MTRIIAHRGCSGQAPENTLAAFEAALRLGVDLIELDIQFSQDEQMVVIHDDRVDRTTDGRGRVGDWTLERLRQMDAGSWFSPRFRGERLPTLAEVLELVEPSSCGVLVEVKGGAQLPRHFEALLLATLERHRMKARALLVSFDHTAIQKVKRVDPSLAVGVLIDYRSPDPVAECRAAGADTLGLQARYAGRRLIEKTRAGGIQIFVWTVNRPDQIRKMLSWKVDGIISDYPDRVLKMRSALSFDH